MGFGVVAREYLQRLPLEKGVHRDIDENGNLLMRRIGKVDSERRQLATALAVPSCSIRRLSGIDRDDQLLRTIQLDPSDYIRVLSVPLRLANGRYRAPLCSGTTMWRRSRARRGRLFVAAFWVSGQLRLVDAGTGCRSKRR